MNNEWQLVSLELSQKLKALKVRQESVWWWTNGYYEEHLGWTVIGAKIEGFKGRDKSGEMTRGKWVYPKKDIFVINWGSPENMDRYGKPDKEHIKWFSAFTVAELDKKLSHIGYTTSGGFPAYMVFYNPTTGMWHSLFRNPPLEWVKKKSQDAGKDKNPADARGKLLAFLLENKLVKAEGSNVS